LERRHITAVIGRAKSTGATDFTNGTVDEVRFSDRALIVAEMATLARS